MEFHCCDNCSNVAKYRIWLKGPYDLFGFTIIGIREKFLCDDCYPDRINLLFK